VRVKKGEKNVGASPTATVSAEQMANAVHGGGKQVPATPGQTP